jgi:phosphinothricin acetyltransferase
VSRHTLEKGEQTITAMDELIYRDATLQDLERIVEKYNSTISSRMVTADTEPVTVESRIRWFHEHTPPKRPLWVLENKNREIIGWVSFQSFYGRPVYDATIELSICLEVSHRSKGLGKQVLCLAIDEAPKFGVKTILIYIFVHNEPSIKLFRRFDFEVWATLPNIASLDGVERSLKNFGKRIA